MQLSTLNLFREVVKRGSFSEAARKLGLPPSSVSRQIDALEQELSVRLFQRTTRQLRLTDVGKFYFDRISDPMLQIEALHQELADLGTEPHGLLRVTAPTEFTRVQLAPRLGRFLTQYPKVEIELSISDRFVDLVRDEMDIGIRFGRLRDTSLIARRLAPDPAVLCAAPEYLRRAGEPELPTDLANHNCLQFSPPGETEAYGKSQAPWYFTKANDTFEVEVRGNLIANNIAPLITAAIGGLGVMIAPRWSVDHFICDGRLVPVLDDFEVGWSSDPRWIQAVYPSARHLPLKVRKFVDFLVDDFRT